MAKGVNIAGMGIVSSLGIGVGANLAGLRGESDRMRRSQTTGTTLEMPVGEVVETGWETPGALSRTAQLGLLAAREAVVNAGLPDATLQEATLISSTTVGGMDVTPLFYQQLLEGKGGRLRHIREHDSASGTEFIAKQLGIGGPRTTISTACSSGANAIMNGARLIAMGLADVVVCGGTDALCKFTIDGFNSLMILSDEKCRPLSAERKGLNLGEGAAFLVLTADHVTSNSIGRLTGWANANDAHHQTAISADGDGAQRSMREALETAGLTTGDIDYINLHGTATTNNDASELAAIGAVWGEQEMPAISSTKAFTGHTLAAAGAIEAVFCLLALQEQQVWANLRFGSRVTDESPTPTLHTTDATVRHAMSNSLGFGGNCTTLIFSAKR